MHQATASNLRCWTDRDSYWALHFDLTKAVKARVEAAGCTIPFPQRDLHLVEVASPLTVRGLADQAG